MIKLHKIKWKQNQIRFCSSVYLCLYKYIFHQISFNHVTNQKANSKEDYKRRKMCHHNKWKKPNLAPTFHAIAGSNAWIESKGWYWNLLIREQFLTLNRTRFNCVEIFESFHHNFVTNLRNPKCELSGRAKLIRWCLQMDGIEHTSHSDCGRSRRKCTSSTASSRCG